MNKVEDGPSLIERLKHFLHIEPQNREELIHLLRDAKSRSLIDDDTLRMLEGVIQFAQLQVRDIMVPKNQMISIDVQANIRQVLKIIRESGHSRFPVLANNNEEIIGILHAKDLFQFDLKSDSINFQLPDIAREASVIPESKRLDILLSEFRANRNHMAIVVDEYGVLSGFVTIEDIIEQIIGDIEDEFDIDEEDCIKIHENNSYVIKGHTPISELNERLKTNFSDAQYDTISGILMEKAGHLPQKGERIFLDDIEFKVINADARRIKLLSCTDKRSINPVE